MHLRDKIGNYKCRECGEEYSERVSNHKKKLKKYNKCICQKCCRSQGRLKMLKNGVGEPIVKQCKKCKQQFIATFAKREQEFCGRACQSSSITRTDSRFTKYCTVCEKQFKTYDKNARHCSKKCTYTTSSISRRGKNNPAWKSYEELDSAICQRCNNEFKYSRNGMAKGRIKAFCSKECRLGVDTRKVRINTKEIIEQYPRKFRDIRPKIKNRDNNCCSFCGFNKNLEVHHIDYNKKNNESNNLLTLCKRCHTFTHYCRNFWKMIIQNYKTQYKIRQKSYGFEIINIKNKNEKYFLLFKNSVVEIKFTKQTKLKCLMGYSIINSDDHNRHYFNEKKKPIDMKPNKYYNITVKRNLILQKL